MSSAHERNKGTGLRLQGAEAWPQTPAPWVSKGPVDWTFMGEWLQCSKARVLLFQFPPEVANSNGESAGKGKGE